MTGRLQTKTRSSGKEYIYVVLSYKDKDTHQFKNKWCATGLLAKGNKKLICYLITPLSANVLRRTSLTDWSVVTS